MVTKRMAILDAGSQERGQELKQAAAHKVWTFFVATQSTQALAMYVFY